jgi:hypothetical protein
MSENYRPPTVVVMGDVRDLTHGSAGPLYDGHYSGKAYACAHHDTVETTAPLPSRG